MLQKCFLFVISFVCVCVKILQASFQAILTLDVSLL